MENKFIYFIFVFLIVIFRRKKIHTIKSEEYIEKPKEETFAEYFAKFDEKQQEEIKKNLF